VLAYRHGRASLRGAVRRGLGPGRAVAADDADPADARIAHACTGTACGRTAGGRAAARAAPRIERRRAPRTDHARRVGERLHDHAPRPGARGRHNPGLPRSARDP
jgi:hypothetical protein